MRYRNAKYIDETRIDCEIEHPAYGWIPYTLDPKDTDMTIDNNYLLSEMAKNGNVAEYQPPSDIEIFDAKATEIRREREFKLITEVDTIAGNILRWNGLTPEQQQALSKYRQELLDITNQETFPHSVSWPVYTL